jgi:hypothetical protein
MPAGKAITLATVFGASVTAKAVGAFWARVDVIDTPGACWRWRGIIDKSGYPIFRSKWAGAVSAKRVACALLHGEVPAGWSVRGTCPRRACIRHVCAIPPLPPRVPPVRRELKKERIASHLDEIRAQVAAGKTQAAVARDLNVSPSVLCKMLHNGAA